MEPFGRADAPPRVLLLADRNILANQAFNDISSFAAFAEDGMIRIKQDEIAKRGRAPKNGNLFFTIFHTFSSGRDAKGKPAPSFGDYHALAQSTSDNHFDVLDGFDEVGGFLLHPVHVLNAAHLLTRGPLFCGAAVRFRDAPHLQSGAGKDDPERAVGIWARGRTHPNRISGVSNYRTLDSQ